MNRNRIFILSIFVFWAVCFIKFYTGFFNVFIFAGSVVFYFFRLTKADYRPPMKFSNKFILLLITTIAILIIFNIFEPPFFDGKFNSLLLSLCIYSFVDVFSYLKKYEQE